MKKALSIFLIVSLVMATMTFPGVSEVDAVTSATYTAPAPAPAPTTAPAPVKTTTTTAVLDTSKLPAGSVYTVISGDAFWKIAKNYNLTIDQLAKFNPQVKNISLIYPGQKLVVKAAAPTQAAPAPTVVTKKLFHGFGEATNYRNSGHVSMNITTASVIFDQDGKIVNLTWDVQEITPESFPAWQTTPEEGKALTAAIDDKWQTKQEEGFSYDMTGKLENNGVAKNASGKEWFEQLDFYEDFFKGKTVAEVEAWFKKYTDANGRPYKLAYPDKLTDTDKIAIISFTAEESKMLVDVTTSATMSLQDGHSHFMTALKEAYAAREEIK